MGNIWVSFQNKDNILICKILLKNLGVTLHAGIYKLLKILGVESPKKTKGCLSSVKSKNNAIN